MTKVGSLFRSGGDVGLKKTRHGRSANNCLCIKLVLEL